MVSHDKGDYEKPQRQEEEGFFESLFGVIFSVLDAIFSLFRR